MVERPRDSQQTKVWTALAAVQDGALSHPEGITFIKKVTSSSWWKKRCPNSISPISNDRPRCGTVIKYGERVVEINPHNRTKLHILHQLTHVLMPDSVAWHGSEFCSQLTAVVERFVGSEAKQKLVTEFRNYGVKRVTWSPEAKSPEAKERAKERALEQGTPITLRRQEEARAGTLELLQDLMASEPEPEEYRLSDGDVEHIAHCVARDLLLMAVGTSTLRPTLDLLVGPQEPERIRAALTDLANSLTQGRTR